MATDLDSKILHDLLAEFVRSLERSFNRIFVAILGAALAFVGAVFAAGLWAGNIDTTLESVVSEQKIQTITLKELQLAQAAGELPKAAERISKNEDRITWILSVIARDHDAVMGEVPP